MDGTRLECYGYAMDDVASSNKTATCRVHMEVMCIHMEMMCPHLMHVNVVVPSSLQL